MYEIDKRALKRLRDAVSGDIVIDDILEKLNFEEMELIGDLLIAALNGSRDEFSHRLFDELLAQGLENDRHGKWKAIQAFIENIW